MISNVFNDSMLECEVYRNNLKVSTCKGIIFDSVDYNYIRLNIGTDIKIGDDIYCPIKDKHYIIVNVDIVTLKGKPHHLDAYFENNFNKPISNTIFNTYNPSNSIIGNQQTATINISDSFKNLNDMIDKYGYNDKQQLLELMNLLQNEVNNNIINKSIFSKFGDLLTKYSWLVTCISDIIVAWIQRG